MRIAMLNPMIGEAFGTERVMKDSTDLLRKAGHEVFFLGEQTRGRVPENDGFALIPGLHNGNFISWPPYLRKLISSALLQLERFRPDVVHLLSQYDRRFMSELSHRYPVVMTAHLVSATCPASARLIPSGGGCQYPCGWSCLVHHQRQNCLGSFNGTRARTMAVTELLFRRQAMRKFKTIFMISEYVMETFLLDGWPKEQLRMVYNPVDLTPREKPPKDVPKNLIFCASRFERYKGIDLLIEALKKIETSPWTAWIAGGGSLEGQLKELVKSLGLQDRVKWLGKLSYEETRSLMSASRFTIQTNRGPEPFGLSIAEASAQGAPVIVTNVPALDEMVDHGANGLVCAPTPTDIANGMRTLLEDDALCARMRKAGPELIARRFSGQVHLAQTLEGYRAALGGDFESAKENESKREASSGFSAS